MAHDLYPLPPPDLTRVLEQHLATAFPPDLAFELVLNELVVRAADATGARTAALALLRGDEIVWRAATGPHAPGLGVPLNTRDGLSGACVRSRASQLCHDAETDRRVDSAASQSLGFRSMLIVPVFDERPDEKPDEVPDLNTHPELIGVLEVRSPVPHAFSPASQSLLEEFAREASHVRHAAEHRDQVSAPAPSDIELLKSFEPTTNDSRKTAAPVAQPYEGWTLALGTLVILAAIGISFMVGSRVGWLGSRRAIAPSPAAAGLPAVALRSTPAQPPPAAASTTDVPPTKPPKAKAKQPAASSDKAPDVSSGDLVVYDKGKVIFRLKPQAAASASNSVAGGGSAPGLTRDKTRSQIGSPVVPASSSKRIASSAAVWLEPNEAEQRLLSRVDPPYPADALAAHRSGSVVLEVNVGEDGTVTSVRPLTGDPLLARAAAAAVRSWRYQPYRSHDQPSSFQTDVTMTFLLSN